MTGGDLVKQLLSKLVTHWLSRATVLLVRIILINMQYGCMSCGKHGVGMGNGFGPVIGTKRREKPMSLRLLPSLVVTITMSRRMMTRLVEIQEDHRFLCEQCCNGKNFHTAGSLI